ncbi:hypothetical protein HMPREF0880_01940 [Yokenella regensburgei ATCC 43003]|nr:hypothetical protein HMPREF0880_01940 [Yokenella regensburgei ATCC 43003]
MGRYCRRSNPIYYWNNQPASTLPAGKVSGKSGCYSGVLHAKRILNKRLRVTYSSSLKPDANASLRLNLFTDSNQTRELSTPGSGYQPIFPGTAAQISCAGHLHTRKLS